MHQIWTVSKSYCDCIDALRNNVGDLSGHVLKECHNVVLKPADTADGILIYNTVMWNLVWQLDHSVSFRNQLVQAVI